MRKLGLLFLLAWSSIIALAAAKPEKQTLTSQGAARIYYTFVPEKLAAPAPLLLLLHGSGRDGMSQIDEWKTLAEKEGIILAAPDSANSREWSMNTDGPEFLHDVVKPSGQKIPWMENAFTSLAIPRGRFLRCTWA